VEKQTSAISLSVVFSFLFFIYMPERFIKEKPREKKQVRKNQSEKQQLL